MFTDCTEARRINSDLAIYISTKRRISMRTVCKRIHHTLNTWITFLDKSHLEWLGIVLLGILLAPILYLGEGCVFEFHDQLDETILSYVFAARYPGAAVYEQMMNGLPAAGLKPSAVLFVLLYRLFPAFQAFLLQYVLVLASAFYGMYACVKRLGKSSIIAFLSATAFCMLPFRPVYGLSVVGVPLLIACILNLRDACRPDCKWIKMLLSLLGILYFALTTNLVLIGYVALFVIGVFWLWQLIARHKNDKALLLSGGLLLLVYGIVNFDLVKQLFTESAFISHREEYVIYGNSFWNNLLDCLKTGAFHAYSYHKYMWIPVGIAVVLLLVLRKKEKENGQILKMMGIIAAWIALFMLLYSLLASEQMAALKNSFGGMLKSFQFERFCWALPAAWHLLFGLALTVIFVSIKKKSALLAALVVAVLYLPTLLLITKDSIFYQNVNQINNGSRTGYMTWEGIFAEDVMSEIEETIGREMSEYRVASLGMCPAVSLMHGFYTIDGYSNNYPLSYKHEFREIIAGEMEQNETIEIYFDTWGSRCYLFYSQWGTYYKLAKTANAQIDEIALDFDKMREMGCEYLFSAADITCAEELGLEPIGVFESETSWWKIWVYRL